MADKLRLDETEVNDWTGERDQIIDLYARRMTISYIASALGRSPAYVAKVLRSEFEERNARRQDIVQAHASTLSWMIQKATKRLTDAGDRWDRRDADLVVKLLERESRMFGIDQPTQHEVKVEVEQYSDEEIAQKLRLAGIQVSLPPSPTPSALPPAVEDAQFVVASDPTQPDAVAEGGTEPPVQGT